MATPLTLAADQSGRPVGLMPMREAVSRLAQDLVDDAGRFVAYCSDENRRFRSQHLDIPAPLIIINYDDNKSWRKLNDNDTRRLSRRVVFARDRWSCQYCDFVATSTVAGMRALTLDHVKPVHLFATREQATTYDNVVTSCLACNRRKGGRLPMEAGMMPRSTPMMPHFVQLRFAGRLSPLQRDYVETWFRLGEREDIFL